MLTRYVLTITHYKPLMMGGSFVSGTTETNKHIPVVLYKNISDDTPIIGEVWEFEGKWQKHPEYGNQLLAKKVKLVMPSGKMFIDYIANHNEYTGLGIKRATYLWRQFGMSIYNIFNIKDFNTVRNCLSIQEIPDGVLINAFSIWEKHNKLISLLEYLHQYGFESSLARKLISWESHLQQSIEQDGKPIRFALARLRKTLINQVEANAEFSMIERLNKNPYILLAFSTWKEVDKHAGLIGHSRKSDFRLVGAITTILYEHYSKGSTCVPLTILKQSWLEKLGKGFCDADFDKSLKLAILKRIYITENSEQIVVQAYGPRIMELQVKKNIECMVPRQNKHKNTQLKDLDKFIREYDAQQNFPLHHLQKKAIKMSLEHDVAVITGGAGVGKTMVLKAVIKAMEKDEQPYFQMALSGRAAHQMRQATEREASTIASFLNRLRKEPWLLNGNPRIIIDEASMLDLPTAYQIIRRISNGKLLMVGDHYQLKPIGPGLIFNKLIESSLIPTVELTKVHRQQHSTGIPQFAKMVREGLTPEIDSFHGQDLGISIIECKDAQIFTLVREIYERCGGYVPTEDVQILSAVTSGASGTKGINIELQNVVAKKNMLISGSQFYHNDKILYTKNDYDREIWNGSLGRIIDVFDTPNIKKKNGLKIKTVAMAEIDEKLIELTETDLVHNIVSAYSITVHKAQGSQFKTVIIPVSSTLKFFDLTMLYTALTRGINQVIFVGERTVISKAIDKGPSIQDRNVSLSFGKVA